MLKRLKTNIKNDVSAIDALQAIASLIGITPPIDLKNLNESSTRGFVPVTILAVFVVVCALSTIGKLTYLYQFVGITVQITDLSVDFSLVLSNSVCFFTTHLLNGRRLHGMLVKLRKLDEHFRFFKADSKYANSQFWFELVAVHILYVCVFSLNCTVWLYSMDFFVYQHFLLRDVQYYFLMIQFLLMRYYALLIKYRYELLNRILSDLRIKGSASNVFYPITDIPSSWSIRRISAVFTVLGEIVDEYNHIFGWQYFTMYIHTLVNLLLPINIGVVYGDGRNHIRGVHFGPSFIIFCLIWSTMPIVMSLGIFSAGGVVTEASKTSTIAFNILQRIPSNAKSQFARSELLELALRASTKCPKLTAANFFTVNYKTLFSLYGSVTSYLIVLMQYNK